MGLTLFILYNLLAPVLALIYLILFCFSSRRGLLKKLPAEIKERLTLGIPSFPERPFWFHAASVGEVNAIEGLIRRIRERYPSKQLMITTSTYSGKTEALKLTPHAFLLPLDSYPLMRRFISGTRPELLMIAETELWPSLLYAAGKYGVKVVMINARISGRTLGFYSLLSPLIRLMFNNIWKIAVQSGDDLERYSLLPGVANKLLLTGNIKYDLVAQKPRDRAELEVFFEQIGWKGKRIFCAGSTHPEEENIILDAFLKVKAEVPEARLVLVPRHPETSAASLSRLRKKCLVAPLWSQREYARPCPDCVLIDEIGRLADIYCFSEVVFVGGTLDDTGGHNLLEPSVFSKPVFFGPNIRHTREGAKTLMDKNGGFMVKTADELAEKIISLLQNPSALSQAGAASRSALESLQGATARTMEAIESVLRAAKP
jgi:3-deoxy-D-manno-octulosonic-acid transferase